MKEGGAYMRTRQRALWWGLPLLAVFIAAQAVPFAFSVRYSLLNNSFQQQYVGIGNYTEMFRSEFFLQAMRNTAYFTVPAVFAVMAVALLLAAVFREMEGNGGMRMTFVLPMLLPSAAVTLVFDLLFGGDGLSSLLGPDMAKTVPVFFLYVWKNTGLLFIILYSAMRMVPKERYEAASLDGAGGAGQFLHITLPSISGALLFSATYAVMQAFRIFKEAYLLYGAYPGDRLYMLQHYMNNHFGKLNFQNVAAAGVMFTLICLLLTAVGIRAEEKVM